MGKVLHGVLQVLGAVVQVVNIGAVPGKYQVLVAAAVGLIQAGLAVVNHGGTSGQVSK